MDDDDAARPADDYDAEWPDEDDAEWPDEDDAAWPIGDSGVVYRKPYQFQDTRARSARVWSYLLGGKDHFPADRDFADRVLAVYPDMRRLAREARAFLGRAVTFLAAEAGIRQFLDIGTGLPTDANTHQVAQRAAPDARVVYVDNDPVVLVHARALLVGTPEGATGYVEADVRDPEKILTAAADTLDLTRPVALLLLGVLGNVADLDEAYAVTRRLVGALPAGSYLAVQDGTHAVMDTAQAKALQALSDEIGYGYQLRSPEQIAHFLDGLDLVDPGVVSSPLWRPDPALPGPPAAVDEFCGVGRKR